MRLARSPLLRQLLALSGHLLFQLHAALLDHGYHFGAVLVVRVKLLKQRQVVLPKALGALPGLLGRLAQQLQRAAGAFQAGLKQLALDPRHAPVAQLVPVGHVFGPGNNFKLRKVCFDHFNQLDGLLNRVNRHHQHPGSTGACGAQ